MKEKIAMTCAKERGTRLQLPSLQPTPLNALQPRERLPVVAALARLLVETQQTRKGGGDETR